MPNYYRLSWNGDCEHAPRYTCLRCKCKWSGGLVRPFFVDRGDEESLLVNFCPGCGIKFDDELRPSLTTMRRLELRRQAVAANARWRHDNAIRYVIAVLDVDWLNIHPRKWRKSCQVRGGDDDGRRLALVKFREVCDAHAYAGNAVRLVAHSPTLGKRVVFEHSSCDLSG